MRCTDFWAKQSTIAKPRDTPQKYSALHRLLGEAIHHREASRHPTEVQCVAQTSGRSNPPSRSLATPIHQFTNPLICQFTTGACRWADSNLEVPDVISVFTNPVTNVATLSFMEEAEGAVSISLLDVTGREVQRMAMERVTIGSNETDLDLSKLPAGIYFCIVRSSDDTKSIRIIKE